MRIQAPPERLELWLADDPRRPVDDQGSARSVPPGWAWLPAGDTTLTRRVKAAGPSWTVRKRRGRRVMSQGLWAPAVHIEAARETLDRERADPAYRRRLEAGRRRRARAEADYADEFAGAVRHFLAFHPRHQALAGALAAAIAMHATPVGSGTVARTQRIPVARRAEAATLAWMRHHTTNYDALVLPRVAGLRRDVRRQIAAASRELLERYRRGDTPAGPCPLRAALDRAREAALRELLPPGELVDDLL